MKRERKRRFPTIETNYDNLDRKDGNLMDKMITRKEAAQILGISITTLDQARTSGLISFVQYVDNGCVYFTETAIREYIARCTHRAKPIEKRTTYRNLRRGNM